MESFMEKDSFDPLLYEEDEDEHETRPYLEKKTDILTSPFYRPQSLYHEINERSRVENRTYWVESTNISSSSLQASRTSIKIKVRSCRNGQRTMETKKRDSQQGFKQFRQEKLEIRTKCDILDPYIDKFSLIKARRRRTEQNRKRERIFKSKKPLKESRKSPIFESSEDDKIEIDGDSELYDRSDDFEHFTIDLKRVGIASNEERIEDKLLASSISHFFKKKPNISIQPIDQEDLKTLSKDGYIKTESLDKMNKENTPTSFKVCNSDDFPKKTVIITPEHLNKIKSKLKAVSYEKSITKSPTHIAKENEADDKEEAPSLPNLEVENHTALFSYCEDGLQPPTLIPEMNCSTNSPIVYLETKPDVTELNREMAIQDTPSSSISETDEELTEKNDFDSVINCSEGSRCQHLDVFVAKDPTDDTMKLGNGGLDNVDLMRSLPKKSRSSASKTASDDCHSNSDSEVDDMSPPLAITTFENQVPNTNSLIIDSNCHSNHSCKTSSISHQTTQFTTIQNSSYSLLENSSCALPSESNTAEKVSELDMSSRVCEQKTSHNQNEMDNKNTAGCPEGLTMCAEPSIDLLEKSKRCQGLPIIQSIRTNKSFGDGSCLVAKEPSEAACVNGYDSDATYVYDEDDYDRDNMQSDKMAKGGTINSCFSSNCPSDSALKIKNSEGVAKLKKTFHKTLSLRKFLKQNSETSIEQTSVLKKSKGKKARNVLRIKLKPQRQQRKKQTKSKTDVISKDLTLTISPRKNLKPVPEGRPLNKAPHHVMKLHDVFNFDECDDVGDATKALDRNCLIKKDSTTIKVRSKKRRKKNTIRQGVHRGKRNSDIFLSTTTIVGATENTDEDDLPKILPPKRRRNVKCGAAMKNKPFLASNDMERLIQEFPRHNWLENKYKTEETARDPSQDTNTSPEIYEYSLDEGKMQSIETLEHFTEKKQITTQEPVVDVENSSPKYPIALTPEPRVNASISIDPADKQEEQAEDDRLQIVTDGDQNHQEMDTRIPSDDCTTSDDLTENQDISQMKENGSIEADETKKTCDGTGEFALSVDEQIEQTQKSTDNVLPPVPHLIKAPDVDEDTVDAYDEVDTRGNGTCSTAGEDQRTIANVCTSAMEVGNACDVVTKSSSIPDSTLIVTSNIGCGVSANQVDGHVTNARKRRLVECEEIVEQDKINSEPPIPDHVPIKSPKIQGSPVMDINKFKEIIAARVKNDIDHQLQKTLKEFQELDQLAAEKAREAEMVKKLREKKLKDLQQIQQNNSEMEIKRVLNEKLRNMDRQKSFNMEMNSPPPAHQRPKQNIRELLDKMDRSHSQTPIDCSTYSAYSTRKTPLHSPKSCVDSKRSTSAHSQLPSVRNDVSRKDASIGSNNIPHAHETEKSCDTRASSAPVSCFNQNGLNNPLSYSDARPSAIHITSTITNSRPTNSVKHSFNPNAQGNTYIDLSQRNTDSEVEIQRELSRALAAKRQKQDINIKHDVSKTRDISVIREPQQAEESYSTRHVFHPSNAHQLHNTKSKDIRGVNQYPPNTYPNQLIRPVSYGGMTSPQNQSLDRVTKCSTRLINPSMIRPHAVRLLGATALGNGQQPPMDGRQAYHTYGSSFPRSTYHNTGSIQQGTPIRPVPGIVSPTQSNTRTTYSNGVQSLENGQILRHIPITAARTTEDPQRESYVQQAAISSLQPTMRPRSYMRPLAPASSVRVPPTVHPTVDHDTQKIPLNAEVLITQSPQQTKPNVHMNVNGKCIVCSKFALYLCSKCQLFWYCSPQCQLKHWVTHQHQCKNSSAVSKQSATDIIIMEN